MEPMGSARSIRIVLHGKHAGNESLREASEGGEDDFQDPGSDHAPFVVTLRS